MKLSFKKLDERAIIPSYAHESDSGMDVRAVEDGTVNAQNRLFVHTAIAAVIPEGYELQVRPRSGLSRDHGVMPAFGTIDEGYRGEIGITLMNHSMADYRFKAGDKIAQLVLAPVVHAQIEETTDDLGETDRGAAGFGSTGA